MSMMIWLSRSKSIVPLLVYRSALHLKDIMLPYSLMVKLVLVKRIPWRDSSITYMTMIEELFLAPSRISSSIFKAAKMKKLNLWSGRLISKFIMKSLVIFSGTKRTIFKSGKMPEKVCM